MAKKRKPEFRIREGCREDWDAMERSGAGTRRCERCRHDVLDLTRLTRSEAERVVERARAESGRVCIRIRRDESGPIFVEPPRPQRLGVRGLVLAASLAVPAVAASGCERGGKAAAMEGPAAVLQPLGPPALPPPPPVAPMVTLTAATPEAPLATPEPAERARRKHRVRVRHPVHVNPPPMPPMPYYEVGDMAM